MGAVIRDDGGNAVNSTLRRLMGGQWGTATVHTRVGGKWQGVVDPPTPPPVVVGYHGATGFAGGASTSSASDADLTTMMSLATGAHMRFCRIDATWSALQPTSGVAINWAGSSGANLDRVVNKIIAGGLEPLLILTYPPGWAAAPGGGGHPGIGNASAYGSFCAAVATHFKGRVVVYEICNEPNLSIFWTHPDVALYTAALKAAYSAIKGVDSTMYVLTGGLSPNSDGTDKIAPITFVNGIYNNGGQGFFDGLAMHPYCYPTLPNSSNISWSCYKQQWTVHDIMSSKGDGAKLVWNTESGAPCPYGTGAVDEPTQAETIRQVFQSGLDNSWMGPQLIYTLRDPGVSTTDREMNFGVVKRDFTHKQAYATCQLFGQ